MSSVADNRRRHSRHQITGATSAQLVHGADQTPITCDGVDLSQTGIGITTDRALAVGTKVLLAIKGSDVQMVVKWVLPPGVNGGKHRLGLEVVDHSVNLEDLFFSFRGGVAEPGASLGQPTLLNGAQVRAARFEIKGKLRVEARTFGISEPFDLTAANVSRSGLLLMSSNSGDVPFRVQTLLELRIDPKREWTTSAPIECLGKVVRIDGTTVRGTSSQFAVQLIELTDKAIAAWDRCLEGLQKANDAAEAAAALSATGTK